MPIKAVALPFKEQSEFLRRKINLPTEAWTDIYSAEHDWAFVVAGANRDSLLADFRNAVERVVNDGITLEEFRKQFDDIVAKNGWSYNGGRNWRSRVIYETNLNSTYNAGRYEQLLAVKDRRPYWQYLHNDAVEFPRPLHQAWDGLILRWDDPWWNTHFPQNGWGCQCRVIALSDADLQRLGLTVGAAPPIKYVDQVIGQRSPGGPRIVSVPEGIDPSFEHVPGRSRLHGATPPPAPLPPAPPVTPAPPLPSARVSATLLPENVSSADAGRALLEGFDAVNSPRIFDDVLGNRQVIGPRMVSNISETLNRYTPALEQALRNPAEIWARTVYDPATGRAVVRRAYVSRITIDGVDTSVAIDIGGDGWGAAVGDAADIYRQGTLMHSQSGLDGLIVK